MDTRSAIGVIAVDTNLLVYAHRGAVPQHAAAKAAIVRAARDPEGWGVPALCLAELWMVATHPSAGGRPSTPAEVVAFVESLSRGAGMIILEPREGMARRLISLAARMAVTGVRIFDLQIGLCALEAGATRIWSHDRAFVAPPGLAVVDPL